MVRVLISACLLGERVRYDGADAASPHPMLATWMAEGRVVPFCPEVAGGLGVPRPAAEIQGGSGAAVLDGGARVTTRTGADVTGAYLLGARLALDAASHQRVGLAILKEGSPSCGSHRIYDGSFSRTAQSGQGVTTALLERHGIRVFSEEQLEEAAEYVRFLETRRSSGVNAAG